MSDNLSRLQRVGEGLARRQQDSDRGIVVTGGGGPGDPSIDERVARLEVDIKDVKATLARLEPMIIRIDAQVPHLATKVEFATTKTEIERLRGEVMTALAGKPGRGEMWMMGITLFSLVVAAFAAGVVGLPLAEKLLHAQG